MADSPRATPIVTSHTPGTRARLRSATGDSAVGR